MTVSDLSPIMRKAYESLPESEREAFLLEQKTQKIQTLRGAIVQVMARNQSHHVGKHVLELRK